MVINNRGVHAWPCNSKCEWIFVSLLPVLQDLFGGKKKRKKKRNQIFILQKRSFLNRKAPEVGSNNDIELFSICIIGFITPCDYVYRYIRVNFSSWNLNKKITIWNDLFSRTVVYKNVISIVRNNNKCRITNYFIYRLLILY